MKDNSCTCKTCVDMCKYRPCWPTPDEALAIIKAGYASSLMRDYWCSDLDHEYRDIICPAIVGYEGRGAPFWPVGRCTFLTNDDKCAIHHIKPIEGREATCKPDDNPEHSHEDIALMWPTNSPIVELWHKEVDK